ncbi:hypothetical protein LEP1GSC188_3435 [Leptospira weilii serovar Topaz str. LT2116]|uniref:Uncharacterized protein n=1 Tax=Leptospira weilii serovar Topaz str. LT2116 TaxID=1088540 RepID=M3GVU0_9LEPT|nr:hypothetical protein LEP1GSC188_3435 [Leptospira weilii serovar Topaz str. LT2116]
MEKEFNVRFRNNHIDIIFFLRSLGIKGGLKAAKKFWASTDPKKPRSTESKQSVCGDNT